MSEQHRRPAVTREWALFLYRLIFPIGLGLIGFWRLSASQDISISLLVIAVISVVSIAIMAMLLANNSLGWASIPIFITLDTILILVSCLFLGEIFSWTLAIPALLTGSYYGMRSGGVVGLLTASIGSLLMVMSGNPHVTTIILIFFGAPLIGSTIPVITSNPKDELRIQQLENSLQDARDLGEDISRKSNAMLALVYEMAEILSASRMNPERVLNASLVIGVEGLKQLDIEPPIYSAFLLFERTEEGYFLRPAQVSSGLQFSDFNIRVRGETGVIGRALTRLRPMSSRLPASDPEIGQFATFRLCNSLLCIPLLSGDEAYGVFVVGTPEEDAFQTIHAELLRAIANQTSASLSNAQIYGILLEQRDRMVEIESVTRAQLASDLHDGPTQSISAIAMRLNYIRRLLEKQPDRAIEDLYAVEDMARRSATEIRHFLFEMRPKSLDDGLARGLNQMAEKMKNTYGQDVTAIVDVDVERYLDEQVKHAVFSIALESVNNARKHSGAESIAVEAFLREDALYLTVKDNGKGFVVADAIEASRRREGHLGLTNLFERADLIGGKLEIHSAPGEGTTVMMSVPLKTLADRIEENQRRQAEGGELVTHRVKR